MTGLPTSVSAAGAAVVLFLELDCIIHAASSALQFSNSSRELFFSGLLDTLIRQPVVGADPDLLSNLY